ncbi:SDR family oxidoreductase [Stagnimonas aquatica]|uniref:SDR family oxidoreductase n=1 Tax=Stagnimonas aquatica TaxID=2689987 RepID=A0A3N0VIS5_9GAMM|nr:SDR family oxidoreductase [Stagnimonas aquatica]ROH92118.1 SDR family oxidoreductase [Stagnimonas aquatica]
MSKTILVVGASSGLGRACAQALAEAGHRVYAASRRPPRDLAGCKPLALDVDREDSVQAAITWLLAAEPRIDVLINCAGFGIAGAIEDSSSAEAQAQFETNFFGAVRVTRALLPQFRAQAGGLIVQVGSLVTQLPVPFQAYYCASKAALESWAEALRFELAPFGIAVVCIEPGNFATGFTAQRRRVQGWTASSPYAARCEASVGWMEEDERKGLDPRRFVGQVLKLVEHPRPVFRHLAIAPIERLALWLRALLPQRWYERLFRRLFHAH